MELAIELFNTLESLEAKGMHKQADQLANAMIRMAFPSYEEAMIQNYGVPQPQVLPAAATPALIPQVSNETLETTKNFNSLVPNFNNLSLDNKLNSINTYLAENPNRSKYMNQIISDLMQDDNFIKLMQQSEVIDGISTSKYRFVLNAIKESGLSLDLDLLKYFTQNNVFSKTLDEQLKYLDDVLKANPSLNRHTKTVLEKIATNPDFDVLKLAKFKDLESAAELTGLITPTKFKDIAKSGSQVAELGTKGKKVVENLEAQAALRAAGEKIPVLKGAIPTLLKFLGIVGFIPPAVGIVTDWNKYGNKIFEDSELTMKFGQNLISLVLAAASMFPFLAFITLPLDLGINYLFEKGRKEVKERQSKELLPMLEKARKHVEYLLATQPKIKITEIIDDIKKSYSWATMHNLDNQAKFDEFLNVEIPNMVKAYKDKNKPGNSLPQMPSVPQGGMAAGNFNTTTGKWEFKTMANNKQNRTIVAGLIDACRQYEKEQRYTEADCVLEIAIKSL